MGDRLWSAEVDTDEIWVSGWLHDREGKPHRGWMVSYRVVRQGDQLVVAEIRIAPTGEKVPAGGLVARQIRSTIRTGEALDKAREAAAGAREYAAEFELPLPEAFVFTADVTDAPRRVGRAGRPDSFYAQYARAYVNAIASGSGSPVADVAAQVGEPSAYVRDVLHNARKRGLLTQPPKGRSGGQLTDKARKVLAAQEQELQR